MRLLRKSSLEFRRDKEIFFGWFSRQTVQSTIEKFMKKAIKSRSSCCAIAQKSESVQFKNDTIGGYSVE